MTLRRTARGFLSLLSFMTLIPLPTRDILEASSAFYLAPLAGLIRGLIVSMPLYLLMQKSVDRLTMAGLAISLHMVIQGFIHVDGFIDYSEALLSSRFGRSAHEVLKDRHRGSYAIASMCIYGALITSSIASTQPMRALYSLTLAEILHATSMVLVIWFGSEEPYEGLAKLFKRGLSWAKVIASLALSLGLLLFFSLFVDLRYLALSIVLLLSVSTALYSAKKALGYVNGDVAGFTGELTYILFLMADSLAS